MDIALETFRAIILLVVVIFLWNAGRSKFQQFRNGWNFIILGFGLLLFASFLDISDNFENLNRFIIIGDTEVEAFLEKFVGYLGGFIFLAVGLFKWIPGVQGLSDLVDDRTRDIQDANRKLISEIAERERAEMAKHAFLSTISHELRTPLTSIKGSIGLIKSGAGGQNLKEIQSMLDIAYSNTDRLSALIDDLLDIEKLEANKMNFNMEPLDMVSLVEEALEANKGYGDEYGVSFVLAEMEENAIVNGDRARLMQVMSNLMSNAAKFSPAGENVELSVTHQNRDIRIAVKDNGPGIPESFKDDIFEKFTQIDMSDRRSVGGTGLGLSISKEIIEHHNGTIDFTSEEGIGSIFFFSLPQME